MAAAGSTTTVAASRSTRTRPAAQGQERGRGRAHRAARRRQFGGDGYKVSGGLHGVGVSVVNALSERLVIEVDRDGKHYLQEYAKGGKPQGKMRSSAPHPRVAAAPARRSRSGPTPRSSSPRAPSSSPAPCSSGCRRWPSSTRASRSSSTTSAPSGADGHYQYKGGIVDFVKHLNASKEALFSKVAHYEDEDDDDQTLDIAIQWNTGYYEGIHGYANGISTIEGGMHVEGFKTALTSVRQQVRPGQEPAQGERRQPSRRRHPRRHHRDHLGEAPRAAVRGSDQGQARQRADALVRQKATNERLPNGWKRTRPRPTASSRRRNASVPTMTMIATLML